MINTASRVIFENQHYVACITRAGLSVQSKWRGSGKILPADSKGFEEWVKSFEASLDNSESNSLCRAIISTAA